MAVLEISCNELHRPGRLVSTLDSGSRHRRRLKIPDAKLTLQAVLRLFESSIDILSGCWLEASILRLRPTSSNCNVLL